MLHGTLVPKSSFISKMRAICVSYTNGVAFLNLLLLWVWTARNCGAETQKEPTQSDAAICREERRSNRSTCLPARAFGSGGQVSCRLRSAVSTCVAWLQHGRGGHVFFLGGVLLPYNCQTQHRFVCFFIFPFKQRTVNLRGSKLRCLRASSLDGCMPICGARSCPQVPDPGEMEALQGGDKRLLVCDAFSECLSIRT